MRELREGLPAISRMCQRCGKGVSVSEKSHTCSASDVTIVGNMLQSIPEHLKGKLAHSLLREQQEVQKAGASVQLPPPTGGRSLSVRNGVGSGPSTKTDPLTHSEIIQSSTKIHLSGAQLLSQAADLQAKWGRRAVEPGLQKAILVHNQWFK